MEGWTPPPAPPARARLVGRHCRIEPIDPDRHAPLLLAAFDAAPDDRDWTYVAADRPRDLRAFRRELARRAASPDPLFRAILLPDGRAGGSCAFLRIDPPNGAIEIGHLAWAPALQRSRAGTEAVLLLAGHAFELGFRRLEWKCDALNARSRRAALRLGFTFEGVFRRAMVVRGRNRDTAWFSITDREWPAAERAMRAWLADGNFGPDGGQRRALAAIRDADGIP